MAGKRKYEDEGDENEQGWNDDLNVSLTSV
jgi:hypothetical protein